MLDIELSDLPPIHTHSHTGTKKKTTKQTKIPGKGKKPPQWPQRGGDENKWGWLLSQGWRKTQRVHVAA